MNRLMLNRFLLAILLLGSCFPLALHPQAASAATTRAENDRATKQLFQAVHANDLPAAQASVGEGANVDARDRWGMTPADIAVDRGYYRIAHFLVSVRNIRKAQEATPVAPRVPAEPPLTVAGEDAPADDLFLVPQRAVPESQDAASTANTDAPVALAAWPADRPNPFDPQTPAPGAQFRPVADPVADPAQPR